jgi:hypothetical protein
MRTSRPVLADRSAQKTVNEERTRQRQTPEKQCANYHESAFVDGMWQASHETNIPLGIKPTGICQP